MQRLPARVELREALMAAELLEECDALTAEDARPRELNMCCPGPDEVQKQERVEEWVCVRMGRPPSSRKVAL